MENASTLFLCSLMHSCATRYPKTRRARSRCRNLEHATMIVEREARADCFWVLQASAGVVHGLHGVLLLPCAPVAHVLGPVLPPAHCSLLGSLTCRISALSSQCYAEVACVELRRCEARAVCRLPR